MAKRLKTRLSAGAALVTGIGMMGIATTTPAHAEVSGDLTYTCEVTAPTQEEYTDPWDVTLTLDTPAQVAPGADISAPKIRATITPGDDAQNDIDPDWDSFTASIDADYTFGGEERTAALSVPDTPTDGEGTVAATATGTGEAETAPAEEGEIDIIAGDFTATVEADEGSVKIACTAPEDDAATLGSITVAEDEPTEDDWFNEPSSLPLADNVFTVEGTATRAGTLSIEVLGEATDDAGEAVPGEVLETHTWDVTEGSNTKDFDLNEGAGYVRIVSQDCVDANGDDETVEGSGCNVLYTASWVDGGDNGDGEPVDDGDGAGEDGSDDTAGEPEVPEVVQTDGFQPATTTATTPVEDNTLALTLGGLLLAGAGAGTVLVARRRAASQL